MTLKGNSRKIRIETKLITAQTAAEKALKGNSRKIRIETRKSALHDGKG